MVRLAYPHNPLQMLAPLPFLRRSHSNDGGPRLVNAPHLMLSLKSTFSKLYFQGTKVGFVWFIWEVKER